MVAGEDHPKACTGRALARAGLVRVVRAQGLLSSAPLLLDPHAGFPLVPGDRSTAERVGVLAVDCSWNLLAARGGYPAQLAGLERLRERRRLPLLIAANPQHFGRLGELTTAEALAASLFLLGERTRATALLGGFAGGSAFFEVNRDRLDRYVRSRTGFDVLIAEQELFSGEHATQSRGAE